MYKLDPPAIYVSERVLATKATTARAKNIVEGLGKTMEDAIYMADEDIPEIVRKDNWKSLWGSKMGQLPQGFPDPVIVLNTFRWGKEVDELAGQMAKENPDLGGYLGQFLGHGAFCFQPYNLEGDPNRKDKVCRPAWRIHIIKALSTESWSMWKRMAPKLGMTATDYVCGCGAQAVPGLKKLKANPFQSARQGCRMLNGEPYRPAAAPSLRFAQGQA